MRKVPSPNLERQVAEALDLVHLGAFAQRYPSELSGGQKQRVAMARALVIQPPVLLLDEPMGALDAKLREEMQIELRALQRRVGITTIMVTHDQAEAMTLADRVVLMNQGRIQQIARPVEMYEEPNGRFSSTFLGKANVFEGARVALGIAVGGRILPCLADACEGDVDYIIRPEKIGFVQTDPILRGNVAARLFLGHHWLFQIQTDLGLIQVTQANVELPAVAEGDEVGLSWRTEHARVITRNLS
jgi:putative spermidine/putrescine transport system ATP-binding protein